MRNDSPRWALPAILALALGLRLLAWSRTTVMMGDGADFLWQARNILDGQFLDALAHPYHPLYGAGIALAARSGMDLMSAGAAVSILGGMALVLAAWPIGRAVLPDCPGAAPATALVAATQTRLLAYSTDIQSEGLFMGLFAMGLWALLAAAGRPDRTRTWGLAGLLTGLSFLTRQEGLLLGAVPAFWWIAARLRPGLAPPPLSGLLAFGAGLILVVTPYVLGLHAATGAWGLSAKPSMAGFGLTSADGTWPARAADSPMAAPRIGPVRPPGPPPEPPPPLPDVQEGRFADDPLVPESDSPLVIALQELLVALRVEGALFTLVGLPLIWRRRRMFALGASVLTVYLVMCAWHEARNQFLSTRHMTAPIILLLPVMGGGLARLVSRPRTGLTRALVWSVVALALYASTDASIRPRRDARTNLRAALEWSAGQLAPDQGVGVRRKREAWYAQRPILVVRLPCPDDLVLAAMEQHGIAWLVLERESVEQHAPHWLTDGPFEVVRAFDSDDDARPVVVLTPIGSR